MIFLLDKSKKPSKHREPPGPPRLPLIGNLHQFDSAKPQEYLRKLCDKYGPLISLKLGNRSVIVIGFADMAREAIKNNDIAFSGRPSLVCSQKLSYNGLDVGFANYGNYWREMRKINVLHLLSIKKVQSFRPIHEDEIAQLVNKVSFHSEASSSEPINIRSAIMSVTSRIICRIAFGNSGDIAGNNRRSASDILHDTEAMLGGFFLSDYFPSLGPWVDKATGMLPRLEKNFQDLDSLYEIKPNTFVLINAWAIARDPKTWEDPNEFKPERFLNNDHVDVIKGQYFELIPFGTGRRGCPGASLALATVELVIANLLNFFDWELPSGMKIEDIDTEGMPRITMFPRNPICLVEKKRA
ncbi:hypothetical protein OROHE_006528 [Orobanche hederae]